MGVHRLSLISLPNAQSTSNRHDGEALTQLTFANLADESKVTNIKTGPSACFCPHGYDVVHPGLLASEITIIVILCSIIFLMANAP